MTKFHLSDAVELARVINEIEACDQAIERYAELGISGTVHDIEHKEMRERAMRRLRECHRRIAASTE